MTSGHLSDPDGPVGFVEQWLNDAGALSPGHLKHARRWLTLSGLLALVAGIVAIVIPAVASVAISIFVGWVLIAAGIVMTSHAFASPPRLRISVRLLEAIVTVLIGLYIVIFPLTGTITLTFALAVWFFATGVARVAAAFGERGVPGQGVTALSGIASVVLGILIAVSWPASSAWAIGLLVGINLLFWAARAFTAATLLRRLGPGPWRRHPIDVGRRRARSAGPTTS